MVRLFGQKKAEFPRYCPVCGGAALHRLLFKKWGYPIVRCCGCGVGAAHTEQGFDPCSIYREDYFDGRRVDGYGNYLESEKVLRAEFRRTVHHVLHHVQPGSRLLEVGCAYGFLLAEAAPHLDCVGVEICPHAVDSCRRRGLDVYRGPVTSELLRNLGTFDAVVMLDVIEHIAQPDELLFLLSQALRPGGVLLLTTGDWDSLASRLLGRHWRLLTPPQHLYFFSPKTLCRLLGRVGLEVAECVHPWKVVPAGLAVYQLASRLGLRLSIPAVANSIGLPINLFDTVRLTARKTATAVPSAKRRAA